MNKTFEITLVEVAKVYTTKTVLITNADNLAEAEHLALTGDYDEVIDETDETGDVFSQRISESKEIKEDE